jgi:ABC-type antimicrobial peptide transport system ATPase subunit
LRGEPPSPTSPPSGCRFRTRCPHAQQVCAEVVPPAKRLPDGRQVSCHFPGIAEATILNGGAAAFDVADARQGMTGR